MGWFFVLPNLTFRFDDKCTSWHDTVLSWFNSLQHTLSQHTPSPATTRYLPKTRGEQNVLVHLRPSSTQLAEQQTEKKTYESSYWASGTHKAKEEPELAPCKNLFPMCFDLLKLTILCTRFAPLVAKKSLQSWSKAVGWCPFWHDPYLAYSKVNWYIAWGFH